MRLDQLIANVKSALDEDGPEANIELARQATPEEPRCRRCGLRPADHQEYVYCASEEAMGVGEAITADEYVQKHEGTYNVETGGYWCSYCYIEVGQPRGKAP